MDITITVSEETADIIREEATERATEVETLASDLLEAKVRQDLKKRLQ